MVVGYLYIFSWEMSTHILCPFKKLGFCWCWAITSIGLRWGEMWTGLSNVVLLVTRLNQSWVHTVCILLYPSLMFLGKILAWIFFWGYQELRGAGILYLWLWIIFLRWHISFRDTRATMRRMLLTCFLGRSCDFMVFQGPLSQIVMWSSWATSGRHCGGNWGRSCYSAQLVIPKLMVKPRWSTEHSPCYYEPW